MLPITVNGNVTPEELLVDSHTPSDSNRQKREHKSKSKKEKKKKKKEKKAQKDHEHDRLFSDHGKANSSDTKGNASDTNGPSPSSNLGSSTTGPISVGSNGSESYNEEKNNMLEQMKIELYDSITHNCWRGVEQVHLADATANHVPQNYVENSDVTSEGLSGIDSSFGQATYTSAGLNLPRSSNQSQPHHPSQLGVRDYQVFSGRPGQPVRLPSVARERSPRRNITKETQLGPKDIIKREKMKAEALITISKEITRMMRYAEPECVRLEIEGIDDVNDIRYEDKNNHRNLDHPVSPFYAWTSIREIVERKAHNLAKAYFNVPKKRGGQRGNDEYGRNQIDNFCLSGLSADDILMMITKTQIAKDGDYRYCVINFSAPNYEYSYMGIRLTTGGLGAKFWDQNAQTQNRPYPWEPQEGETERETTKSTSQNMYVRKQCNWWEAKSSVTEHNGTHNVKYNQLDQDDGMSSTMSY